MPESFLPWLRHPALVAAAGPAREDGTVGSPRDGGSAGPLPDPVALETAALAALARALSPGGRERAGAFDLLAADAFVTWAAEAGLDEEDPETRLRSLVRRVARAPGAG